MKAQEIIIQALHDNFSEFTEDQASAVIEALKLEGFVLVPKEPTLEMCHRGRNTRSFKVQDIYKAMIKAQEQNNADVF